MSQEVWKNIKTIDRNKSWERILKPIMWGLGLTGVGLIAAMLYGIQMP